MKLNDPTLLKDRCYVGGAWVGESTHSVNNPATGELVGRVPRFGAAEATDAVETADAAFPSLVEEDRQGAPASCAAGST